MSVVLRYPPGLNIKESFISGIDNDTTVVFFECLDLCNECVREFMDA